MATRVVMPKLGMVMSEGTLARWTRAKGEAVREGEVIAEIETEKISYELEATVDGIVHPLVAEGTTLPVDGLMGWLLAEGEAAPAPPEPVSKPAPAVATSTTGTASVRSAASAAGAPRSVPPAPAPARAPGKPVPSTPGARKLAARLGVDLAAVTASGPAGRVTEADVETFSKRGAAPVRPPAPSPATSPSLPPGLPEPRETVPLSRMRRAIGDHMRASLASTAQLSFFLEVDVTEAQRRRRESSAGGGVRVTFADVVLMACARALERVPALNSRLAGNAIHRFAGVNIGLAVAMDDGVVVPVVKEVQTKRIDELARATRDLVLRARAQRLRPDELTGGTFSLSVIGQVDGFTPILNDGQTAILGVGRSVSKPAVKDGEVTIRELATMSLSVDHQVVDGAHAAAFMRRLQQALERPEGLFSPRLD